MKRPRVRARERNECDESNESGMNQTRSSEQTAEASRGQRGGQTPGPGTPPVLHFSMIWSSQEFKCVGEEGEGLEPEVCVCPTIKPTIQQYHNSSNFIPMLYCSAQTREIVSQGNVAMCSYYK